MRCRAETQFLWTDSGSVRKKKNQTKSNYKLVSTLDQQWGCHRHLTFKIKKKILINEAPSNSLTHATSRHSTYLFLIWTLRLRQCGMFLGFNQRNVLRNVQPNYLSKWKEVCLKSYQIVLHVRTSFVCSPLPGVSSLLLESDQWSLCSLDCPPNPSPFSGLEGWHQNSWMRNWYATNSIRWQQLSFITHYLIWEI